MVAERSNQKHRTTSMITQCGHSLSLETKGVLTYNRMTKKERISEMKETYIADIRTAQEVTDFFMVKSIAVKIGANKKQ